jgi:hypothetical protein
MSERSDAPNQSQGYEKTDIHVAGILSFAGGLIVLAIVLHFVLTGMFHYFAAREEKLKQQLTPLAAERGQLPGEPRLEGLENPPSRSEKGGYTWVDRKTGVVRIPIDSAMKILADRLPSRPEREQEEKPAEPGSSSSGRTLRKGQP